VLHAPSRVRFVETGSNTALLAFLSIEQQFKTTKGERATKIRHICIINTGWPSSPPGVPQLGLKHALPEENWATLPFSPHHTENFSQNSLPLCYLLVLLCRPCLFAVLEVNVSAIAPVEVAAQESAMAGILRRVGVLICGNVAFLVIIT
jgi:hypothetical protein